MGFKKNLPKLKFVNQLLCWNTCLSICYIILDIYNSSIMYSNSSLCRFSAGDLTASLYGIIQSLSWPNACQNLSSSTTSLHCHNVLYSKLCKCILYMLKLQFELVQYSISFIEYIFFLFFSLLFHIFVSARIGVLASNKINLIISLLKYVFLHTLIIEWNNKKQLSIFVIFNLCLIFIQSNLCLSTKIEYVYRNIFWFIEYHIIEHSAQIHIWAIICVCYYYSYSVNIFHFRWPHHLCMTSVCLNLNLCSCFLYECISNAKSWVWAHIFFNLSIS